jgi:F-type H+-transporting ATPase subunit epsilon
MPESDFLHLSLILPDREFISQSVEMVVLPAEEGDIGVLPGHVSLITPLRVGVIYIFQNKSVHDSFFVVNGLARITAEGCFVMAEEFFSKVGVNLEEDRQKEKILMEKRNASTLDTVDAHVIEQELTFLRERIRFVESPSYS